MFCIALRSHILSNTWFMSDTFSTSQVFERAWYSDINNPSIKKYPLLTDTINELNTMVNNPNYFGDASKLYLYAMFDYPLIEHLIYDKGSYAYVPNYGIYVPNNNTPIVINSQQQTFTPGDALKQYRSGDSVDWVELAKKYGGE